MKNNNKNLNNTEKVYEQIDEPKLLNDDFFLKMFSSCTDVTKTNGDGYIRWTALQNFNNHLIDVTLQYIDHDEKYVKIVDFHGELNMLLMMYHPICNPNGVYYLKKDLNKLI